MAPRDDPLLPSPREAAAVAGFAALYALLGAASFITAYVQANTATVWMPAGFSIGLLVARGRRFWPAVTLGAFLLNLAGNRLAPGALPLPANLAVAAAIALGNTGEALLGAHLSQRFAGGRALLSKPTNVMRFGLLVATLPPLVSMGVGVAASRLGGLVPSGPIGEVMLTWYIANAVGILILTAPVIAVLGGFCRLVLADRLVEAFCFIACLLVASQAITGAMIVPGLHDWPRSYMVIPLLLWAAFRFAAGGALVAILLVAATSIIGTMRGFEAFPSPSHSRSLLYLQLFLSLNALTTLAIAAALSEIAQLRADLVDRVRMRTGEVESLVRSRDLFTALAVHDLRSPLYGVRNTLRAASRSIREGHMSPEEAAAAMAVMDDTCTQLASRITELLLPGASAELPSAGGAPEQVSVVVARVETAQRAATGRPGPLVLLRGGADLPVRRPIEVERILEGLVGNALKFGPPGQPAEVYAYRHAGNLEMLVIDQGAGVRAEEIGFLFRPEMQALKNRRRGEKGGLGLYLASEQAGALGGRLTYHNHAAGRSTFKLVVPA